MKYWKTCYEDPPKMFTQEEVDALIAEKDKTFKQGQQRLVDELQALKQKATLTAEERAELDTRIKDLQEQLLTKEELAKQEADRLKAVAETQLKTLTSERDTWRNKYVQSTIVRSIVDAAVSAKAYNPEQIVALLQSDTNLKEEKSGEEVNYVPRVKFRDVDKEGKPVILDLTVPETVKRMKEIPKYQNLFVGDGTGGLGNDNNPNNQGKLDIREIAKDPVKYRKFRAEGKI